MNGLIRKIHLALLPTAILLACWWLSSCSKEEEETISDGDSSLRITITTDGIGDLNATRAYNGDDNAEAGEFMNTLCVFICNESGTIERKLSPDCLSGNDDAEGGNLQQYTWTVNYLTWGTKTIYAFSNWNNVGSTEWNELIAKEEGQSITANDLTFCIDDPAATVDINNKQFIPMSGMTTATVGIGIDLNNSKDVSVGLVRLVGKVKVSVSGADATTTTTDDGIMKRQSETYKSLTIGGFADKVWLFSESMYQEETEITNDITKTFTYTNDNEVSKEEKEVASFYVNETTTTNGFPITLDVDLTEATTENSTTTTETSSVEMKANTNLKVIPRNNIFPLVLSLDNYELSLCVEAYTAGIGTSQEVYTNTDRVNDYLYIINLREITSYFKITPRIKEKGETTAISGITWNWTGDHGTLVFDTNGKLTVSGLTATAGYEYTFTLSASWNSDGHNITRTYTVLVKFSEGDFKIGESGYQAPAYDSWGSVSLPQERLNMTTSKRSEQNIKEDNGL